MPMPQWKFSLTPADRKRLQQLQRVLDRPSEADALRTVLRQRWDAEVASGGVSKADEREIRRVEREIRVGVRSESGITPAG